MPKLIYLFVCSVFVVTGCASTMPNPISSKMTSSYESRQISVSLAKGEKIPDRYDKAAREYIDFFIDTEQKNKIEDFIVNSTPSNVDGEDYTGEALLLWLVKDKLNSRLNSQLSGDVQVDIDVELASSVWPNAATMMLVGEVIGASFNFSVEEVDGSLLIESSKPIRPIVSRGKGAGGGVLGMALRGGGSQHLNDLQRVADSIANSLIEILTGKELSKVTLESVSSKLDGSNENDDLTDD